MVLRHLVENDLVIADLNLGDGCFVQEEVTTMIKSGLLTTKHDPVDQNQRSPWFGSAYRSGIGSVHDLSSKCVGGYWRNYM